ncbi:MAG: hypothetical protein IPN23_07755 [Elusimicrobia bacterium]|nr:hypothetical protein [Elusimicrobiota bacterium]
MSGPLSGKGHVLPAAREGLRVSQPARDTTVEIEGELEETRASITSLF